MPGNTVSNVTRNDIIDRAVDGNPNNNRVTLSARDYILNGPGRFIRPTFASGVREIVDDKRLPAGQTISYQALLAQYGYDASSFRTKSIAQLYLAGR